MGCRKATLTEKQQVQAAMDKWRGTNLTNFLVPDTLSVQFVKAYREAHSDRPRELSPCRYEVTCSAYALQVLQEHGTAWGWLLTARRIASCRPGSRPIGKLATTATLGVTIGCLSAYADGGTMDITPHENTTKTATPVPNQEPCPDWAESCWVEGS